MCQDLGPVTDSLRLPAVVMPTQQPVNMARVDFIYAKATLRQLFVSEVQANLIRLHSESVDASDTQVGGLLGSLFWF